MSASEKEADARVRNAILAALHATGWLPVQPLVAMIVQYTLPFYGIVTTIGWSGRDSPFQHPQFVTPFESSLLVTDSRSGRFYEFFRDGRAVVMANIVRANGLTSAPAAAAAELRFDYPAAISVDPLNRNRFYLCDYASVRVMDRTDGTGDSDRTGLGGGGVVTDIAGSVNYGFADGCGSNAKFSNCMDLVCTSDGRTLYVADMMNDRLRAIDLRTRDVTTVATPDTPSFRDPIGLAFERRLGSGDKPDTVLYVSCYEAIVRCELALGVAHAVKINSRAKVNPCGLAALPNGCLVFACPDTRGVYALDPTNGELERLAGLPNSCGGCDDGSGLSEATFEMPNGLCVIDDEQCVMVADSTNRAIRCLTLSPHYFSQSWKV